MGKNEIERVKISRGDAATLLGVSAAEIRRKQATGQLRVAKRGQRGLVLYYRDEIENLLTKRNTEAGYVTPLITGRAPFSVNEASRVFAELRKGTNALDCVERCEVHPDKIESIMRSYERLASVVVLDPDTMKAINSLPLDGTFPVTKASDVLALLADRGETRCAICSKHPRHLCKGCAIPFVRKQLEREAKLEKKQTQSPEPSSGGPDGIIPYVEGMDDA